jgi:tripartite-type tricarboxylate transporter receptor subunit TctC
MSEQRSSLPRPRPAVSRRSFVALAAGMAMAPRAFAQAAYPVRPLRIVVPNAPGSSVDTIGRVFGSEISRILAQPTVIDNRVGAAGAIGVEIARTAVADGYTLLIGSSSAISVAPLLQKALTYQPLRDFDFVSMVAQLPNVLVCNPSLPVNSLRELIAYIVSKGGNTRMASAGMGSASHLAGLALQSAGGFTSLHVPYKGGAQGVASVVSGETDWVLTPAPAAMGLVAAKRLRLLGHSMPPSIKPLGNTPSLGSELPGFEFSGWIGLMSPRGVSPAILDALAKATASALQSPELLKAFESNGAVPSPIRREEFRAFVARDIEVNRKVVAVAGIKAE